MLPDWNYVRQVQGERIVLANAYLDMGHRARAARDYQNAQQCYQRFLSLIPNDKMVWVLVGECWCNLGKYERSQACYQQALACDPGFAQALMGLAECLTLAKRPKQALKRLKRAEALMDDDPLMQAHLRLARGNAYYTLGDNDRAEAEYRQALKLKPDLSGPLQNLGNILIRRNDFAGAMDAFTRAYAASKDPTTAKNIGILHLLLGNYAEGWDWYDARIADPRHLEFQRFAGKPLWDGGGVGTLYVCAEQGLGDLVHFARYLPATRAFCKRLILEVTQGWEDMAEAFGVADEVRTRWSNQPITCEYDSWVPMLSLPKLLKAPRPEDAPKPPYLQLQGTEPEGRPAIALFWRGNPNHPYDKFRSLPLEALAPVVKALPGAHWFTCHPEPEAAADIARTGLPITQHAGSIVESARRLKAADLVISVDTAPAHIASSQGVPTWVLLPPHPDWRWGLGSATTPWYPEMRLFRAEQPRAWGPVVERVREALTTL